MDKVANFLSGCVFALFPLLLAGMIGVPLYIAVPNAIGIASCVVMGILALWAGWGIFKMVQREGPLAAVAGPNAAPETDHLVPEEGSETLLLNPWEARDLFAENENRFKEGTINLFGNWFGTAYDNRKKITSLTYDPNADKMVLKFQGGVKIEVEGPNHIFEADTLLKIVEARSVKIFWSDIGGKGVEPGPLYRAYRPEGRRVRTKTNQRKQKLHVSAAAPAVMVIK